MLLFVGCCFSLGSKVGREIPLDTQQGRAAFSLPFHAAPSAAVGRLGKREIGKGREVERWGVEIFYVSGAKILDEGGKGKLLR